MHDLHPDYASTNYARRRASRDDLSTLTVQHHHAHMASCMAENGLNEPVIGVTLDGTGFGADEITGKPTIWGGEFLVGDYPQFYRAAHLRNVAMPGGAKAIHEPWRMALAHLADADCDPALLKDRIPPRSLQTVESMIATRLNAPQTSSAGRLFDAVASIIGIRDQISFEGQAAMQLKWLCDGVAAGTAYQFQIDGSFKEMSVSPFNAANTYGHCMEIDTRPIIRAVASDAQAGIEQNQIARRFHTTFALIIAQVCDRIRQQTKLGKVVLSGGVFMNTLLMREARKQLTEHGFDVFRHRLVPPNDAGLCLDQLAIAAAKYSPNETALSASSTSKSAKRPDIFCQQR